MLHQENPIKSSFAASAMQAAKILKLNGNTAIQYHMYETCQQASMFLEENSLVFMINGTINISYGKAEYIISKNQMAFIMNNTLIEYQTIGLKEPGNVAFIFISLSYEVIKEFSRLTQLTSNIDTDETEIIIDMPDEKLLRYVDSLTAYFNDQLNVNDSLVKIKLLELLFAIAGFNKKILHLLLGVRKNFRPDITKVVDENLLNPLSINQLAVLAGRSLSSFRRDFLSIYNMPPSQWIRERRLKKAKDFLMNTNMTITDICYTLGFENIAHFSRLFKSQFGHSPSAYRLQLISA